MTVRKGSCTRIWETRSTELRNTKLGASKRKASDIEVWWQECVKLCTTDTAASLGKISLV